MLHYTDNTLNKFMLQHSIDDILTPVEGELLESDTETLRYVVDRIGFTKMLVEY